MADIIGSSDFRCHLCDLCGEGCDQATSILNALDCSFPKCSSALYHQECLEKYLRSIKCEKYVARNALESAPRMPCGGVTPRVSLRNRKTGFKCPRGCGKGTKHDAPCNGKAREVDVDASCRIIHRMPQITKSHPIQMQGEVAKKRKQVR